MRRSLLLLVAGLAVLTGCNRSEVDGVGSYTPDAAAPPQHDIVGEPTCEVGDWGWVTGAGLVENSTDDVATYEVVVAFHTADGVRLGEGGSWIRDLPVGGSARYEAGAWLGDEAPTMSTCAVLTINRWSANTEIPADSETPGSTAVSP